MTDVVLSVPEHSQIVDAMQDVSMSRVRLHLRRSDWAMGRTRRLFFHVRRAISAVHDNRDASPLVICSACTEVLVAALIPGAPRVVAWDFLMPQSRPLRLLARLLLPRLHGVLVIRKADAAQIANLGVKVDRIVFVPFPVTAADLDTTDGGYVYSAGDAHRDWATLLRALEMVGCDAIVSTRAPARATPRVQVLPALSPAEGRKILAGSSVVVACLEDTTLPAGPLIILDALAAGKPVIATNVNGTRDYVDDGTTGVLVPPADPSAMAEALRNLMADAPLRQRLGAAARARAAELRMEPTLDALIRAIGALPPL